MINSYEQNQDAPSKTANCLLITNNFSGSKLEARGSLLKNVYKYVERWKSQKAKQVSYLLR
jgi:hypothetical protein